MSCNIFGKIGNVFENLGDCVEAIVDNRKKDALKSVFGIGKSVVGLTIETTSCVIENTPKVVSTIRDIKQDIVSEIEDGINDYQKQKKEQLLEDKIKMLKQKK